MGNSSRLSGAFYEIHHMDRSAGRDQWVNNIHPLVKLVVTIVYIVMTVSVDKYNLSQMLLMAVYPAAVFILGEISFIDAVKRLRIILPLVCVVGIANPFLDRELLYIVGNIHITTGMISMVTLILKGVYSVLASYLLIATTNIEKICYALRLLHVPAVVVTQILLTYRYISVLLNEANRIMQAYMLRAPNQKGIHFKVWGSLIGQLLLRSIDSADKVYQSMVLRGYKGEFMYYKKVKCLSKDYAYLTMWMIIFIILKLL